MVNRENSYTRSHQGHDKVLVQRVRFPEYGEVEEHDREEFAGFGKDEGYIVDVRE